MAQRGLVFRACTRIAAASVPVAYPGVAQVVYPGNLVGITFLNTLDAEIAISFNGGTTDHLYLDAGEPFFLNAYAANRIVQLPTGIFIKYQTGAPTIGSLRVFLLD